MFRLTIASGAGQLRHVVAETLTGAIRAMEKQLGPDGPAITNVEVISTGVLIAEDVLELVIDSAIPE